MKWIVALLVVASMPAIAFDSEPSGFRGINWGTKFEVNGKEMMLLDGKVNGDSNEKLYTRRNDKKQIGGAALKHVIYYYYKNRFALVSIQTEGTANKTALVAAFEAQFGEGTKPNEFIDRWVWRGDKTFINLGCGLLNECSATIASYEISMERIADKEKVAEEAKKDF